MKILVINSGSSSLKYQVIDMKDEKPLVKGICDKIGFGDCIIKHEKYDGNRKVIYSKDIKDHKDALIYAQKLMLDPDLGVLKSLNEIHAIGHRIVHGGAVFKESAIVTDEVIKTIKDLIVLAPLHNQAHLNGILACKETFGEKIPQIVAFDTAFHSTIPPKAYMYAIPYKYYKKHNIRKYGFHGISHKYVSHRCAELMNQKISKLKIISCHLGNGASITAIKNGIVVDTSMGLSPLGGIMMGTRCGSLDPSVVTFLAEKENLDYKQINSILNKESGLLGVSGISNDDRVIMEAAQKNEKKALLAHDMFEYQIIKYIGAYITVMHGCDAIVFTAGIGENQWYHRKVICDNLSFMGVKIDTKLNKKMVLGKEGKISSKDSLIDVFVIPTNEELVIARDTKECLESMS